MRPAFEALIILSSYVVFDVAISLCGATPTVRRVAALALVAVITAVHLLLREKKRKTDAIKRALGLWGMKKCPLSACTACILLGLALNAFCSSIIALLPQSITASYAAASAPLGALTLLSIIDSVVLAPLLEELIFRNALLGRLRAMLPCAAALVISALVFGSFHGGILWMIYSAACGLALGAVYLKYDSLIPSLVMHTAFNGANYLFLLLPFSVSPYLMICISAVLSAVAVACMLAGKKNTEAR